MNPLPPGLRYSLCVLAAFMSAACIISSSGLDLEIQRFAFSVRDVRFDVHPPALNGEAKTRLGRLF